MSDDLIQPAGPEGIDAEAFDEEILTHEGDEQVGEHLRFRVGNNIKFRRLDRYLRGRFSQFSRSRLQELIREQGVNVNNHPAKPSHCLSTGDEIDIILPPRELRELTPEDIPIDVLYEDDELLVLNKQANLLVHPARGYKNGTLVNGLVFRYADQLSTGRNPFRPGIVHRLDRNTTVLSSSPRLTRPTGNFPASSPTAPRERPTWPSSTVPPSWPPIASMPPSA